MTGGDARVAETSGAMFDSLPCAWLRLDEQGTVIASNAAAERLLATDAAALAGRPFDSLLTGASRVLYQSYLQPLLHLHGNVEEFSLTLATPTGDTVDVLLYTTRKVMHDEGKSIAGVDMVLAPIRHRRKIEDELLRVKRAADHAPGLIFQWMQLPDGRQHFPYTSDVIRRLYGVSAEDAQRSAEVVLGVIHADDRAVMTAQMQEAASQGREWRGQFRVQHPDGSPGWHEMQATSRRLANGVLLWHGHVADVTLRHELETALADRQALERLHRARNEFLARVSHELRTPLNGILGFTQLLATDAAENLSTEQRDRLAVVSASGRHLLHLINEVLEVTSIESGQIAVELQTLALQPLAEQALRVVESQARAAGVVLQPLAVPSGLAVRANEQRLSQVLMNLLSNAIKYNRPGGTVTLSANADAHTVRLVVADTGRGMSPAQLADLFQPFNRLGAETSGTEGNGLGLVISRHLVTLMQGRITVESRVGMGSAFTLELQTGAAAAAPPAPAAPAAPATHGVSAEQAEPADAKALAGQAPVAPARTRTALQDLHGRVLYAEDNEVNAILMRAIVGLRPNVTLVVAPDSTAALREALATPPNLLLLDLHLPEMSGIELLALMRQHASLLAVPAVAVSAAARQEDIDHAQAAGFSDYWTKPLDVDQTLARLDHLLRTH